MAICDIIILSNGKNLKLRRLTQDAVNSCLASEDPDTFKITVIEQMDGVDYTGAETYLCPEKNFNYNRFMMAGIYLTSLPWIVLCNNDLIFYPGWFTAIKKAMIENNVLSASPACPISHKGMTKEFEYGHVIRKNIAGWCIVMHRSIIERIGRLDERFPFHYADNAYAEQLKQHGLNHFLVRDSKVKHLVSQTLNTLPASKQHEFTFAAREKWRASNKS